MRFILMDGMLYEQILRLGYKNLVLHFEQINGLNVFPVPDGDTGTNMKLTVGNGLKMCSQDKDIGKVADEVARGMLFGARGNSGVLTSQYFKGIADYLRGKKEVTVKQFANALVEGYHVAYSATITPTEGTILTVAREGIDNVIKKIKNNTSFEDLFKMVVNAMRISLDNTPNLLPVLKDAGVIDSGGKGLLTIFEGMLKFFTGEELEVEEEKDDTAHTTNFGGGLDYSAFNEDSVLDYGYCTEFLLQLLNSKIDISLFSIKTFINYLQRHGDSIVCFQTGTIVKVHIHTKKPYLVIRYAQRFGEFVGFKMENMALQHNEVMVKEAAKKQERKQYAIISIAQGDGIIETFKELGSDIVLNGGQTMNTSAAEMIDAFKVANADEIILLPNESNILMAAKQAAKLYKDSKVRVIETKTIPDGYNALSMIMGGSESAEEAYNAMIEAQEGFVSGFVTRSIRNTTLDGTKITKGEYITGVNRKIISSVASRKEAVLEFLRHAPDIEDREVLFIFYGQLVDESEVEEVTALINKEFPDIEVGFIAGKQDVYDYLLGLS